MRLTRQRYLISHSEKAKRTRGPRALKKITLFHGIEIHLLPPASLRTLLRARPAKESAHMDRLAATHATDGLDDLGREAEANILRHYLNLFDAIESV
jgi:hypothetical protein